MVERRPYAETLAGVPGQWAAVDRGTHELRLADPDPVRLCAEVRRLGLRGIQVVRAPHPDDVELVGSGFSWLV